MRYNQLTENLGNLAQLNLGELVGILKQDSHGVGTKFKQNNVGNLGNIGNLGNTSDVIDIGVIKHGIKDIRKAYRTVDNAEAFALYIDGNTVAFGIYSSDDLRGRSHEGNFAYDLRDFADQIDKKHEADEAEQTRWQTTIRPEDTTIRTEPVPTWHRLGMLGPINHNTFVGKKTAVAGMIEIVELIYAIAHDVNGTVTLKLVTADLIGLKKSRARRENQPLSRFSVKEGLLALQKRLVNYKNSKRPTVDTIQQFIDTVLAKAAYIVNFAGEAYYTAHTNSFMHKSLDPIALLQGATFNIEYKNARPKEGYSSGPSIIVSYRFNPTTMQVTVWQAQYTDAKLGKQVVPIDPEYWIKTKLKINSLDKHNVIGKLLKLVKAEQTKAQFIHIKTIINTLRNQGIDWPELAVIEHSIDTELTKDKN